jgi:mannose-6-phosphate isomerase
MRNQIQHYAWGTRGVEAFIPRLLGEAPELETPYAELWLGAHPNAPSQVEVDGVWVNLREFIAAHPEALLGAQVREAYGDQLPFLFKVLSAAESLSIQTHPTQAQAERLHAEDPEHYPDANHKPEVAVALTPFTALVGFKPYDELLATLDAYPELADFVSASVVEALQAARDADDDAQRRQVQRLFERLAQRALNEPAALADAVRALTERLAKKDAQGRNEVETQFLTLREKYGDEDMGLLVLFLLNLVHLAPGEGLFTRAGVLHAYLGGTVVECMANSDNVVRAGLTPKYQDVGTLVEILTPDVGSPPLVTGKPEFGGLTYPTPADEFVVRRLPLIAEALRTLAPVGPEIFLVVEGIIVAEWQAADGTIRSQTFERGESFFVPDALNALTLAADEDATLFRVQVGLLSKF